MSRLDLTISFISWLVVAS